MTAQLPAGWYVDEDLLDVQQTLTVARSRIGDVHGPLCGCCPDKGTHDDQWAPALAGKGLAVITHDVAILKRPLERKAMMDAGLGVFILRWTNKLDRFERMRFVLQRWDVLEERYAATPRPFFFKVSRTQVTPVDISNW